MSLFTKIFTENSSQPVAAHEQVLTELDRENGQKGVYLVQTKQDDGTLSKGVIMHTSPQAYAYSS